MGVIDQSMSYVKSISKIHTQRKTSRYNSKHVDKVGQSECNKREQKVARLDSVLFQQALKISENEISKIDDDEPPLSVDAPLKRHYMCPGAFHQILM